MFDDYNKHDVAVYGGYIDDETKLLQSSSGGLATALSEFFLEQGGYVAGVAYSKDFYKAEYTIIHNISVDYRYQRDIQAARISPRVLLPIEYLRKN